MPRMERNKVSLRLEFVMLAIAKDVNMRALCRAYGISPTTGYKWLDRYLHEGRAGLQDRSRRPLTSPNRTPAAMEQRVVALRDKHPSWGGRKINRILKNKGYVAVPEPSTITEMAVDGWIPKKAANTAPGNASKRISPTIFGRWISKGISA